MTDPALTRIVADADVLAADLFINGTARDALDIIRSHSWITLLASDALLDDAAAIIQQFSSSTLAAQWTTKITAVTTTVTHPPGDHPALASALHGDARHILTLNEDLLTAKSGASVRARAETSIKHPDSFRTLFDPEIAYEEGIGGKYPGPDKHPRT